VTLGTEINQTPSIPIEPESMKPTPYKSSVAPSQPYDIHRCFCDDEPGNARADQPRIARRRGKQTRLPRATSRDREAQRYDGARRDSSRVCLAGACPERDHSRLGQPRAADPCTRRSGDDTAVTPVQRATQVWRTASSTILDRRQRSTGIVRQVGDGTTEVSVDESHRVPILVVVDHDTVFIAMR